MRSKALSLVVVLACAFLLAAEPCTPPTGLVRGPYLQMGTDSSAIVRWRTAEATPSVVRYGAAPGSLDGLVYDATPKTEHVVEVAGLGANTRYYYSVGTGTEVLAGGDAAHFFFTSPATGQSKPTRIWVIGDAGTKTPLAAWVRDAYVEYNGDRRTDLWLMLGDNAYPDGRDGDYQFALFAMYPGLLRNTIFWPTLGNHDGNSADSATQSGVYYDIFSLPAQGEAGGVPSGTEAYYSFDYGNIHFVCLDSHETDRSPSGAMMTWLAADLAANDSDWTIAFWHHPPYSKGSHDSDREGQLIEMRENALPILESMGVDLVLTGHSHNYERSYLLDQHYDTSDTLVPSMILDDGDGAPAGDGAYRKDTLGPAPHEGAVYIVAGSSGQVTVDPDDRLDHPAMHVSLRRIGSLVLDVEGSRMTGSFLTMGGEVEDLFRIVKGR